MVDMATLTTFFGWCSIINIGILIFSVIIIAVFKDVVIKLHNRLFGVPQHDLPAIYLHVLGNYEMAVFVLNIVPYFALKIMV